MPSRVHPMPCTHALEQVTPPPPMSWWNTIPKADYPEVNRLFIAGYRRTNRRGTLPPIFPLTIRPRLVITDKKTQKRQVFRYQSVNQHMETQPLKQVRLCSQSLRAKRRDPCLSLLLPKPCGMECRGQLQGPRHAMEGRRLQVTRLG